MGLTFHNRRCLVMLITGSRRHTEQRHKTPEITGATGVKLRNSRALADVANSQVTCRSGGEFSPNVARMYWCFAVALHIRRIVEEPDIADLTEAILASVSLAEDPRFLAACRRLFDWEDALYVFQATRLAFWILAILLGLAGYIGIFAVPLMGLARALTPP